MPANDNLVGPAAPKRIDGHICSDKLSQSLLAINHCNNYAIRHGGDDQEDGLVRVVKVCVVLNFSGAWAATFKRKVVDNHSCSDKMQSIDRLNFVSGGLGPPDNSLCPWLVFWGREKNAEEVEKRKKFLWGEIEWPHNFSINFQLANKFMFV